MNAWPSIDPPPHPPRHRWCGCWRPKVVPDSGIPPTSVVPVPQPDSGTVSATEATVCAYPDSSVYEGQVVDGKRHGHGTLVLPDGTKYDGEWRNDRLNGQGTQTFPDGSSFSGNYVDGSRCGHGVMIWPEGSSYSGQFARGRANGEGHLKRTDGSVYRGSFVDDSLCGEGIIEWEDGVVYIGQFEGNRRNGQGTMKWVRGRWKSYEGGWKDGLQHGKGVLTNANDELFQGVFNLGRLVRWEDSPASDSAYSRVPSYWFNSDLFYGFNERRDIDERFTEQMARLLEGTYRQIRTRDRGGAVPSRLRMVKCHRVENSAMWSRYIDSMTSVSKRRPEGVAPVEQLGRAQSGGPVRTHELLDDVYADRLDQRVNELYLWHGTTPQGAIGISTNGFRMAYAGTHAGTYFGKGCYFAECSSKADEYAREGEDVLTGICALLLCRVVCGQFFRITHPDQMAIEDALSSGEYDSVLGDREASVGTYREFVVYDQNSIYPEYVVLYERKYD